jgi:hypothetical protein
METARQALRLGVSPEAGVETMREAILDLVGELQQNANRNDRVGILARQALEAIHVASKQ